MRWPLPWPRSWRDAKPPEPEALEAGDEPPKSFKQSVLLFARDLAVAFLFVAIIMGALWAYTGVWPPMVVVESDSMQHADRTSFVGVIDTGDLVLVQTVYAPSQIVTYVEARAAGPAGHQTYGAFGDVIIFFAPNRPLASTPIIHRAIVYVIPNGTGGDVPSLAGQGDWTGTHVNGSTATIPYHLRNVTIRGVASWDTGTGSPTPRDVTYTLTNLSTAGFLTKGDHNSQADSWGSTPVALPRVMGRARGELPWFGLLKLMFAPGEGANSCCRDGWGDARAPPNSWDALLISLILILVVPFAADFAWGYYKEYRKKRKVPQGTTPTDTANPDPSPESNPPSDSAPPPEPVTPKPTVTDEPQTESAGPGAGGP